jgi:hypothetical protein
MRAFCKKCLFFIIAFFLPRDTYFDGLLLLYLLPYFDFVFIMFDEVGSDLRFGALVNLRSTYST